VIASAEIVLFMVLPLVVVSLARKADSSAGSRNPAEKEPIPDKNRYKSGKESALEPAETTRIILAYADGESRQADRLLPLVYDNLKRLAADYLSGERAGHTLQPTALVHEAYLRMVDVSRVDWKGKTHFFAMAATQMRRILVDHARSGAADKRWKKLDRVTLDETVAVSTDSTVELLALDESLRRLAEPHERQARIAEYRLFGGLTIKEAALAAGTSERTATDDWRLARAWLMRDLGSRRN
jgi:RNA polymerase sigma-70 factor (ECF subfamily)